MGKGWKNPLKVENAAKKGAITSKISKEISVAVKLGGSDPNANPRLRMAIDWAKEESVPKDTVERAIKKGAGQLDDGKSIEEIMYEGYGPHQVGVLVECQTDNRTRTASDMRFVFKSNGGQMGELGSVAWMFEKMALVQAKNKNENIDPEEEAIEAGANEVEKGQEGIYNFWGDLSELDNIQKALVKRGWEVSTCEISYKAKNKTENLTEEQKKDIYEFLDAVNDNEDCAKIHTTL